MVDNGIGDYFISDVDDASFDDEDELIAPPVVVPGAAPQGAPSSPESATGPAVVTGPAPVVEQPPAAPQQAPQPVAFTARPTVSMPQLSREEQLARALDEFMAAAVDVQAAALVSLDGFTMASALPAGMQEDRVGAMSAAILGLGERAAAELGRGRLSQVFIEGEDGYVLLMAAGTRAVLTALAAKDAKLGLMLYDMKTAAGSIGRILG